MKYLKVFTDFREVIAPLSFEEAGRLFVAMLGYAEDGIEAPLAGNERYVWAAARQIIDREVEAYERKVEANRTNGRKGAKARWDKPDGEGHFGRGENS